MTILEDVIDGITGKTGADATRESGALQAEAITEASQVQAAAQERAMETLAEQLGITREQFAPFLQAGTKALGRTEEASTAGGLDAILNQIMGGEAFGGLVEERQRGVQGQLAAGGLTRSGSAIEEAARVPTDLAFQIENLLTGRQQNLAGMGLNAAAQESGQTGNITQSIINAITGGAQAQAQGITGAAGATATGILGGAQSQAQGIQNLLNLGGTIGSAAILSSDPRLKENVKQLGKIGELTVVSWDWIPELGDDFFKDAPKVGFMSTNVRELYPEYVHEFGGYDAIDYPGLMRKLNQNGESWSTLH